MKNNAISLTRLSHLKTISDVARTFKNVESEAQKQSSDIYQRLENNCYQRFQLSIMAELRSKNWNEF